MAGPIDSAQAAVPKKRPFIVRETPASMLRRNVEVSKGARHLWATMWSMRDVRTGEVRHKDHWYTGEEETKHSWNDLTKKFSAWMSHRIATGKLRSSTRERYLRTSSAFEQFLASRGIVNLDEITRAVVEDFKSWRLARVLAKKHSRGGAGVVLDTAILHLIFGYAVECEMISKNPVRLEGRPGDQPERGAQPFNAALLTSYDKRPARTFSRSCFSAGQDCEARTL